MKTISMEKPEKILIHTQPQSKGMSLVRFRENIEPFIEDLGFGEISGYKYDEYMLELPTTNNLEASVNSNYGIYLSQAKRNDKELMDKINEYVLSGLIALSEIDSYLANDLEVVKKVRVGESKIALSDYLKSHPIQWTDGEFYSITDEKQGQLLATLFAAQVDGQPPEWNTTGGVCKEWKIEELSALAVTIKNRVKALVKYQQDIEVVIMGAESLEALDSIVVDYDTVKG